MFPVKAYMRRQIFRLAWPVVLEMLGVMLVSISITAMMGRFGAVALGAVGLATLIQASSAMVFAAAGTGAAAIVSREVGAGNWEAVRIITGQAVLLGGVCGALVAAAGYYAASPVVHSIGADPAVAVLTVRLLQIMFLASPFFLIMAIGSAILRGMGQTRVAFFITTLSNAIAIGFGSVLIFGWGLPAQGPLGAAYGIAASQLAGGLVVLAVLASNSRTRLTPGLVLTYHAPIVARILNISIPAALEQLALQGGRMAFTFMLAGVGAVQFAGHQIAVQAESLSFMPGFALSVAAMTLTGLNLGRGLPHRARQYVWLINTIAIVGMSGMAMIFLIFAKQLTGLFIDDPEVVYWGSLCIMIGALEQPTLAITNALAGALRGAGDTKWPMYVTTIGVWGARLPLVYLFIVKWHYDVTIAWYITAADFLLRSIVLWRRFAGRKWETIKTL
ncbi:MAG TPA: MATE family efflux transporter [Selenomonadales bacterium]|nr:MATE family efflux transporter [Selenomonadales bacterium]